MAETKNKSKLTVTLPSDREIVLTRFFDAPRELVFEAWTNPRHIPCWWGPRRHVMSACEVDLRPGGAWRFVLRGPDGREYPFRGVYREILPPQRLVITECFDEPSAGSPTWLTTLSLDVQDRGTMMTIVCVFPSKDARDAHLKAGMEKGASESYDRLEEHLQTIRTEDREIVITRVFDAPRELIWQAMTDPKQIIHWWGPRGFSTTIAVMDVRPGGLWRHVMHGPDGTDYPNESIFREVEKPRRIVYSLRGGKSGSESVQFESTWTFDALEGGHKTQVTIRMVFPTAADRDRVARDYGAVEGGKQTLERLAEHLPKMGSHA